MTTTKQLSRNYGALTPQERASLCIRALYRNDDAEFQRICDAAPRTRWTAPDHSRHVNAFSTLTLSYQLEQFGYALMNRFAVAEATFDAILDDNDDSADDYYLTADLAAYHYAVNRLAWDKFCDELGIAAADLPVGMLFDWLHGLCEENLPSQVVDQEVLVEKLKARRGHDAELVTADDLLARWRKLYAEFLS